MFKVLVTDSISDTGLKDLYEHPNFIIEKMRGLSPLELIDVIGNYDVLIVRSET
jgi:D-3-phosphoglycerate dehydrogenase / 2-oxoglutarate reductase